MGKIVRLFPALLWPSQATGEVVLEAPASVPCFDVAEFVLRVGQSPFRNPFTEAELTGEFTPPRGKAIPVFGFADSENGSVFRLRFSPEQRTSTISTRFDCAVPGWTSASPASCAASLPPGPAR